ATQVLLAAGISHSDVAVDQPASTPGALALAMVAQDVGMPVPVGGAGRLAEALVAVVEQAGGTVVTGQEVVRVVVESGRAVAVETAEGGAVVARRAVLADTGPPRLFFDLVGDRHLPPSYLDGIRRFRYGSGIFKLDLALDAPVQWDAAGLDRSGVVHLTPDLEAENPNLVGGDLGGGSMALDQQLVFRPVPGWFRYSTPVHGLYLCSASAHPGGGVHGMVGRNCARRVLLDGRLRRV